MLKVIITIIIVQQNDSFTLQVLYQNHHNLLFSRLLLHLHFQAPAFILYSRIGDPLLLALIVDISCLTPLFHCKPFFHPLSLPHSIESQVCCADLVIEDDLFTFQVVPLLDGVLHLASKSVDVPP